MRRACCPWIPAFAGMTKQSAVSASTSDRHGPARTFLVEMPSQAGRLSLISNLNANDLQVQVLLFMEVLRKAQSYLP